MSLASFSVRNPVFAWMLMIGIMVFGLISYGRLGVSQNPDVDYPIVTVTTGLEGAAPEIIESDVTDVIEDAIMSVEGIREVSSRSRQGQSQVTIEFELSRDIDVALQDVVARVSQAQRLLPRDIDPPVTNKTNPEDEPIMWIALSGTRSPQELSGYVKNQLRDKLLTVPGVGDVRMGGFLERNVRIWLKGDELRALGLGVDEVITAIQRQHVELPAGRIEGPTRVANVRVEGEALDIDAVRNLQIASVKGAPVYVKDVALVEDGFEDRTRMARANGYPAQGMGIIKQRGSNAVAVAEAMRAKVEEIRGELPPGMTLTIVTDNTRFVKQAAKEIQFDIIFAILLTSLVCWLFLGSVSSTFNVIFAIPVSILGTFAVMYFSNFTLNAFSLLAIALCIGIVVDDAIMVLENIYRHAEKGKEKAAAARDGAEQITPAATAATLAIVAIFLPVAFMQGIIGKFFFQFGVVLSVAVMISLLEALTLAPARCSQFMKVGVRRNAVERGVGRAFDTLAAGYRWVLPVLLRWRVTVLACAMAIFGLSLFLVNQLKAELVPAQDQGFFMIRVIAPVGSAIDYTAGIHRQVDDILMAQPEVVNIMSIAGAGELNTGIVFTTLTDKSERKESQQEIMARLRGLLNVFPGTRVVLQDFSQSGFSPGRSFPIEFTVRGPDWGVLADSANQMMTGMRSSGLMVDVDTDYRVGLPEVQIVPDRDKALAHDVDVAAIAQAVNALVGGQRIARYKEAGRRYDVRLRLLSEDRQRPDDIANLFVRSRTGQLVPLSELCTFTVDPSLQAIIRKARERAITVYANPAPAASQQQAIAKVEELARELPEGYRVVLSGTSQVFRESVNSLLFAMVLGVFVAYMVLGSQFNSFIHPITILMALPFSVTGALLALWLIGASVNVYSLIGIILLLGIVKKNSILLVDYTNQMRRRGMECDEALKVACPIRLRPILMTSTAMIAGAIPGAISTGAGSELRRPMFCTIIGGMIVSTLLTLIVIPCFYSLVDQGIRAFRRRFSSAEEGEVAAPGAPAGSAAMPALEMQREE